MNLAPINPDALPPLRQAAILAGGLGTRLRSRVSDRPKVLAPIHGRPYLTYLLDQLADCSIEEIVLLTGFEAHQVRGTLGESYAGMRLTYSEEPFPLGTAGALRWALPKFYASRILLLNGDSYCDLDLAAFHGFHQRHEADLSIALARVADGSRFGRVVTTDEGRVLRFEEKAVANGVTWINAGIYLLERRLIEAIPEGQALSLERDLVAEWIRPRRCYGYLCPGRFLDIGTPDAYAQAEDFFAAPIA